jgi:hypothetical protein
MKRLAGLLGYIAGDTICSQTMIHYICRLGLGQIQSASEKRGPYLAIVDFTMNQGPVRVLPIIALHPADLYQEEGKGVRLQDAECIDVTPMTSTTGEEIADHYEKVFEEKGYPSAFIQDGGGNLRTAVGHLNDKRAAKDLPPIPIIQDLGHYSASIIKKIFEKTEPVQELLEKLSSFNLKVRIGKYSFLQGPAMRTAGRYMGFIAEVLDWLTSLNEMSTGKGRPTEGTLRHFVLSAFPGLNQLTKALASLIEVIEIEKQIHKRLKLEGLTPLTYRAVMRALNKLPDRHPYRLEMIDWLRETWKVYRSLKLTSPLCVSSDLIESANGCWKKIIERSPSSDTTHLILTIPTFFGKWDVNRIEKTLDETSHKQFKEWCDQKLPITQRKLKAMHLKGKIMMKSIDELFASETTKNAFNTA